MMESISLIRLGDLVKSRKGKIPKDRTDSITESHMIPYLTIRVLSGKDEPEYCESDRWVECDENDVLLVWDGSRFGLSFSGVSGVVASTFARLRSESLEPQYLLLFLKMHFLTLNTKPKGTGTPHIDPDVLWNLMIPLFDRETQRNICKISTEQLSMLSEFGTVISEQSTILELLQSSILKAASEGRLVRTEAELARKDGRDYESGEQLLERILAERRALFEAEYPGKKYKEPVKPDTDGLPELPEGWCWASWSQCSERVTVGYVGKMSDKYVSAGIPFLRGQNVKESRFNPTGLLYISEEFHNEIRKSKLSPGDVVVTRSGDVGRTCVIPESLSEANCADLVIIQRPSINPIYGAHYMNSAGKSDIKDGTVGMALSHYNTGSVASMPLAVPPLNEQNRIVKRLSTQLSIYESVLTILGNTDSKIYSLRQSILSSSFSGVAPHE
jgi:type I restriction enzyme, S subunit